MAETSPKFTQQAADRLIRAAEAAGQAAFDAATPTPMYVYTPADPVGSLLGTGDGGVDTSQPVYKVDGGVCGFAWVNVRPANGSFARRAKNYYSPERGGRQYQASKGYYGGLEIRPNCLGRTQSLERQEAATQAYARVLTEAGVTAYSQSRMD